MIEPRVRRRLAAILAADVVGYSRLMREDDAGTLVRLKSLRAKVFDPNAALFDGRIFKTMGDGFLVEFASAVDAVQFAVTVQRSMARRGDALAEIGPMAIRIGIDIGDVIVDGEDLYGDGVNVAARLEALAEPNGICLSGTAYEQVRRKLDLPYEDLGERSVKNIAEPIHVFRIVPDGNPAAPGAAASAGSCSHFDRPAVAVLPFVNMSGEPEQEHFADGLTEDLITALSLWRTFPVIARNSSFAYKGKSPDIRHVGTALGARYVVEGSVRKAGKRIRVTAQLVNAETGHHVWAEQYDRELGDLFDLQDEITQCIAAIIEPTLERNEHVRLAAQRPSSLAAWEYWLKGYEFIYEGSERSNQEARTMFESAIAIDPKYARAHTGLAYTYVKELRYFAPADHDERLKLLFDAARKAVALDGSDSEAHTMLARAYMFDGQFDESIAEARRAVELNPHRAFSNQVLGNMLTIAGYFEEGIRCLARALRLNPLDPQNHLYVTHLALAHLGAGQYDSAAQTAREAIRLHPDFDEPYVLLASALGHLGRVDDAERAIRETSMEAEDFVTRDRRYWSNTTKQCVLDGLQRMHEP